MKRNPKLKQKGTNRNPKGTKSEPKGYQMHQQIIVFSGTRFGRSVFKKTIPFWGHMVDVGAQFGTPWISIGQSARCFSTDSEQSQKQENHVFCNYTTAKTRECKTLKNLNKTKVQSTWHFCRLKRSTRQEEGTPIKMTSGSVWQNLAESGGE